MKVVVTGGRGFLGTHVCEVLRAAGREHVPLGRRDGDLTEPGTVERLLDAHDPQAVVHLAAVMPGDEGHAQNAPITAAESLDTDRLRSLGWRPEIALEDGIRATADWLREAA